MATAREAIFKMDRNYLPTIDPIVNVFEISASAAGVDVRFSQFLPTRLNSSHNDVFREGSRSVTTLGTNSRRTGCRIGANLPFLDQHAMTPRPSAPITSYRFIYFDTRGAGELCRLVLVLSGLPWHDIRYPMRLSAAGYTPGPEFLRDQQRGGFAANMHRLPLLQVVENKGTAVTSIGQTHAIVRFIGTVVSSDTLVSTRRLEPVEAALVDAVYECVCDIKRAWYKQKQAGMKQQWFRQREEDDENTTAVDSDRDTLRTWCVKLHAALPNNSKANSPWCLPSCEKPTIADVHIYHLLSSSTSIVTGAAVSFMDNESDRVRKCYEDLPRLCAIVDSMQAIGAIREWEESRPDTFS